MSLSLQPTPSASTQRGVLSIQPAYFTSSLFIDALRTDIQQLASVFSLRYQVAFLVSDGSRLSEPVSSSSSGGCSSPFTLFKELWEEYGWNFLHLKVLEIRARETFISVVLRSFLELATKGEEIILRTAGLFGLYTFYTTQPRSSIPPVHIVNDIPIPIDSIDSLCTLLSALNSTCAPLRPYAIYVMKTLRPHFFVLPPSASRAHKPPILPRELVTVASEITGVESQRKGGRPTKTHRTQRIQNAVQKLDSWLAGRGSARTATSETEEMVESVPETEAENSSLTLTEYRGKKAEMMSELRDTDKEAVNRIGKRVLGRLKTIGTIEDQEADKLRVSSDGIERLERILASGQLMLELTEH